MKFPRIHVAPALCGALILATLLACSGGAGPGAEGMAGGPMDGSGNYAAGPMSLPAPSIINKGLVSCENVPGPTVQCRGTAGAVPANARVKLTVYGRHIAAAPHWSDWLVSSAQAVPGNTSICNANGAGAFGLAGECSVIAATGEKIGICVASGDACVSAELLLTVPVEGGIVSGATATIKSMATTPDGYIIFGRRAEPRKESAFAFRWTDLFFGTARAQEAEGAPKLTLPAAVAASCPGNPNAQVDLAETYKAPEGQWLTIKAQKVGAVQELFQLPGTQDDLQAINADKIGNFGYISVAMKNTLTIVHRDSRRPMAQVVFPAPIKSMRGGGAEMEVFLEVPKGEPSMYEVKADSFETQCVETVESITLTRPISFSRSTGQYLPPGGGFRVPQPFAVSGVVGENEPTADFQLVYSQEGRGNIPAYEGVIHRQATPLKDFYILAVTQERAQMAALDPAANRILFFSRDLVSGENHMTSMSLEGITSNPVALKLVNEPRYPYFFVVLDSGEQGAKAVRIPLNRRVEGGELQPYLAGVRSVDLGPIVADTLELNQIGVWEWATFDRVGGQVKTFVLGPRD
ncbi:MAG: hypothetical protein IT572_03525 [Deltaproteobacteria bacterium]|nr:hypothetical protein [Deltaproteobacteria bacterium]